jgi:uncharacterized hydrophobic protein (TIGR00271 family)
MTQSNTPTSATDKFQEARVRIEDGSSFNVPYVVMNTLATIVACYGLLENSPAVVIGAMIIAMLLGPIAGVALALVDGNPKLLLKALGAEIGGVLNVLVVALVVGLVHKDIPITHEIMARTAPNFLDLLVALAGGAAGAYATISPRLSAAFVGVAVATALVPPLSSCSMLLARGEYMLAAGAFLLAFTNIVAIQVASSFVMWASGIRQREHVLNRNLVSIGIVLLLTGVLFNNLRVLTEGALFEAKVSKILRTELNGLPGSYLAEVRYEHDRSDHKTVIRAVVRGPQELTAAQVGALEDGLPKPADGTHLELRLRQIHATVMTRSGPIFSEEELSKATAGER